MNPHSAIYIQNIANIQSGTSEQCAAVWIDTLALLWIQRPSSKQWSQEGV